MIMPNSFYELQELEEKEKTSHTTDDEFNRFLLLREIYYT